MSNISPVKKFVLKFDLSYPARPSVVCASANFFSELIGESKFSNVAYVKNSLINNFIAMKELEDHEAKNNQPTIWVYNVKQDSKWICNMKKTTAIVNVYRAPRIEFKPHACDFETMQAALTQSKIGATFFDNQIAKHLESAGVEATRENVRVYRESYKEQISKLLLTEILYKKSTATIVRQFDKINGNSYFSVRLTNGSFSINIPLAYGYGDAEGLVIRALKLDLPRKMRSREYLDSLGVTVVDLGYGLKREMFQAAFHI